MIPLHQDKRVLTGLLVLWLLAAGRPAFGQSGRGSYSLRGIVLDSEGAPVPGAKVIAVLNEQGTAASDLEGNPVPVPGINTLLLRKDAAAKREVEADENGRWAVRLIRRGPWRLQAFSGERMSLVNEIMVRMSKNVIELALTRTDTALLIDAKTAIYARRWEKAAEPLDVFETCFPGSPQRDNARYWLAFCKKALGESVPDRNGKITLFSEAYEVLGGLISAFPGSEWRDDAEILRIELALLLVQAGQARFEDLILEALEARAPDQWNVRLAALEAYTHIDREKAFQLLKEIASSEQDPEARKKSVHILGSRGGKELFRFLRRIAEQDPDESVRSTARLWLKQPSGSVD